MELELKAFTIYECAYDSPKFERLLRECKEKQPHICPSDHILGMASLPLETPRTNKL